MYYMKTRAFNSGDWTIDLSQPCEHLNDVMYTMRLHCDANPQIEAYAVNAVDESFLGYNTIDGFLFDDTDSSFLSRSSIKDLLYIESLG